MESIGRDDVAKVEPRVGRVPTADAFAQARKPACILHVNSGAEVGERKSRAQVTARYRPEDPAGPLVVAVVDFPANQIGPLRSECLVAGFHDADGAGVQCVPDRDVPLGAKLL